MKTIIIAEAGVNHNGDIKIAKQLIDVAAKAGVDYVKFQTFKSENLVSKVAKQADYQKKNIGYKFGETQYEMLKKLELSKKDHLELLNYCKTKKVRFFSTAFDIDSLRFLIGLNLGIFKIPSGEITNLPYLKLVGKQNKPTILSTGMASLGDIENAIAVLLNSGCKLENITVLHCNTEYPTPMSNVNLLAMETIKNSFKVNIGYSDHTEGIEVSIAAVALGAKVIEKHFTLSKQMEGPDHKASIEPEELFNLVKSIRNVEKAISGSGIKKPTESEFKNLVVVRKSIHLNKNLKAGTVLREQDLVMKRPGDGISPMDLDKVLGKKISKKLNKDHKLQWKDLV